MQGDTVGALLDVPARRISFTLNGKDLGTAFELPEFMCGKAQALYPALTLKEGAAAVNFGNLAYKFGPPAPFVGIGSAAAADYVVSGEAPSSDVVG